MKKIFIIFMVFVLVFTAPVKARAVVPEATAFFAAGISWPLVAGILVAGGIGTALWWNSLDVAQREILVDNVKREINARGLSLKQHVEGVLYGEDYIRMAYGNDGKAYIGTDVVNAVYDVANELGYTALYHQDVTLLGNYSPVAGDLVLDSPRMPPSAMISYFYLGEFAAAFSALINSSYIHDDDIIVTEKVNEYLLVKIFRANLLTGYTWAYSDSNRLSSNVSVLQFGCETNGTFNQNHGQGSFSTNDLDIAVSLFGVAAGSSIYHATNLGRYKVTASGTPSGEQGQITKDEEGNYSYPWSGLPEILENFGQSLTLSISNVIGDIKSWDLETDYPEDITLDNVDADVDYDFPTTDTQAIAQAGTIEASWFTTMATATPINLIGITPFLLPNWIENRFPFCVAKDLRTVIDNYSNQIGAEAPHLHYDINLTGYPIVIDIDFNIFNKYAVYIKSYLFLISIAQLLIWCIDWFL